MGTFQLRVMISLYYYHIAIVLFSSKGSQRQRIMYQLRLQKLL